MTKKRPKQPNKSAADYEKLGRMLESIYESGYIDADKAYKFSFLKGIMGGVGGVIGATVIAGLIIWFLTFFQQVPLIGPFVQNVRSTVQDKR